jgi:GntR family transcriptional repressor for pyruvate dehydrogenase complex
MEVDLNSDLDSDFLTPLTRNNLTSEICRKLVGHIIRGQWREGQKIPAEPQLCEKLGVGRASLREALKALEIMGMIEIRLGNGTYVCRRSEFFSKPLLWAIASSSDAQTRELVEARTLIEVEMAGLAAERATAANIERLSQELDCMESRKKDLRAFVQADIAFHLEIGDAAANKILMNALQVIRNLLQKWILTAVAVEGIPAKACTQHRRLLQAIKAHDAAAARKAMQKHLHDMAAVLPKGEPAKKSKSSLIT